VSVGSGKLPSVGFVAVVATYAATAAFFAWGLAKPPLQRVWELHHLMKIGEIGRLDEADRELLEREMDERDALARDLIDGREIGIVSAHLDGWIATRDATLIRTPEAASVRELGIDVQAPDDLLPLEISIRGDGFEETREAAVHGLLRVPLPAPGDGPELIEVSVRGERSGGDTARMGVRITWEGAP